MISNYENFVLLEIINKDLIRNHGAILEKKLTLSKVKGVS